MELSKNDYNKLYSAMNYAKSKGNQEPWSTYKGLTNLEDKKEFLSKYIKTKNFNWVRSLKEKQTLESASSHIVQEEWLSKTRIADIEKLDTQSPEQNNLLEHLLASLPSRAHRVKAWAELGLLEYK